MKQNRTRTAIADAFTGLLAEHTIDKITVRMITDEVGCSRKTFYYYFTDIYDLTKYVCERRISAFLTADNNARENLKAFMEFLNRERAVVLNMFHGYGKEALESFTWQTIESNTRRLITAMPEASGLSEQDADTLIRMYSYMAFGMMVDWFSNDMSGDRSQTLELAIQTLPRLIEGLAKE
ncbi:MAG: TetR/AcrR family transcriptional regulator [Oscillospiraceae bacterium]|nr:TetR/AcrR family transcriptional regulator [Oscillospiraceae bacterium]